MNTGKLETTEILGNLFDRIDTGFIRLTELPHKLLDDELAGLNLKRKKKYLIKEVENALGPLPPSYRFMTKSGSRILLGKSPEELVLGIIAQKPGRTMKQNFTKHFFLKREEVITIINTLIHNGRILVQFRPTELTELYPKLEEKQPSKKTDTDITPKVTVEAFKEAYQKVGPGKRFVEIFKIRRYLGWPREKFDQVLTMLMKEGYVLANPGNPGDLTRDEVVDSFQDEYGDLYITVSWRAK